MRRQDLLFSILATCLGLLAICSFVHGTQQFHSSVESSGSVEPVEVQVVADGGQSY
ncbi:MAG: hypothetical protein AAF456_04790 [Planctomycetota bacterium]